jgi:acetyl-CoA acetyltransferase
LRSTSPAGVELAKRDKEGQQQMRIVREAAVAGVYQTKQGDLSDRSQLDVWWECAEAACDDAGLTLRDVDGLIGSGPPGVGLRAGGTPAGLADVLGRPVRFHGTSSVGAAASAAGLNLAAYAVSTGMAEVVLIVNAVAGQGEGYTSVNRDEAVATMARLSGPYEYPFGTTRVSDYAIVAMRHMYEYGTTAEQLAEVAVAQRRGATLHPLSVYGSRGEISIEDVVTSRPIAEPLRLLDCCAINQGGGAIVVTSEANVQGSGRHSPVKVVGYGEGFGHIDPNALPSLTGFEAGRRAAETAFEMAGVTREDIDVAGISDHFTIAVPVVLEDAGFCLKGEGGPFCEGGALGIGGRLPTNTSGGFLSFSHAGSCGLFSLIEMVDQLRGEAAARQVEGARLGYLHGLGGAFQMHFAAVLARG